MPLLILIPAICAILITMVGKKSISMRRFFTLLPCFVDFVLIALMAPNVFSGLYYSYTWVEVAPFAIRLKADQFAVYMGLLISFLFFFTMIYSFGYMEHEREQGQNRYYCSLILALGAAIGIIFSADLVSYFIFFEGLTMSVYPLVIHEESKEAYNAGVKYMVYLMSGGVLVLLGVVMTYGLTGKLSFTPGGIPALRQQSPMMLWILCLLFTGGFGFKAAIMPLHSWLPDAMIAPTPVSAVLHAVAVVNVGLSGFYRTFYNIIGIDVVQRIGFGPVLGVATSITIIVSALIALRQNEIKRMLAFSTVNQLSYVLLGLVSFETLGMLGALLHIVYHSFMKITLFYAAGAIITQSGNKHISKMGGLAKKMPITMAAFTIAAIGIIGLPPVAGWVSKWYLVQAFFSHPTGLNLFFGSTFILSGLIELGYFTPPIFLAYFKKPEDNGNGQPDHGHTAHAAEHNVHTASHKREAPWTMLLPISVAAVISLFLGIWGSLPHYLAKMTLTALSGRMINF
ncbi:MAG: monovalent cation/H+ antiporter subunit D family protein [Candidatus Schekmanbacteria bacterium]|nr:monovalent cation/H+ antiporter subunit D family protein [Candidatus Schekmanbacteria bacterium]